MKNQIKSKFLFTIFMVLFLIGCNKDDEHYLPIESNHEQELINTKTSLLNEKEVKSNSLFNELVKQTELNRFVDISAEEYKSNGGIPFVIVTKQGQLMQTGHSSSIKLSLYTEKQSMYDIDNLVLVDDHGERKIFWYTYHYTKENYHEFTNDNYYKFELRHTKRELNIAGEVISTKEGKNIVSSIANNENIKGSNCRFIVVAQLYQCHCKKPIGHFPWESCDCTPQAAWIPTNVLVCGSGDESGEENGPWSVGYNDGYFSAAGYGSPSPRFHTGRRPQESDTSGGGGLGDDGGFGSTPFLSDSEVQVFALSNTAGLSFSQQNYFLSPTNQEYVPFLQAVLYDNLYSDESKTAVKALSEVMRRNLISRSDETIFYQTINPYFAENTTDPTFIWRFAATCSDLKAEHPEWSDTQIIGFALLEELHTVLDVLGLFPGAGEICDITNGVIYSIEGRGVEAGLSFAAAIPFAGWVAGGAKLAAKTIISNGSEITLRMIKRADGIIDFGKRNSAKFRKTVGLVPGDKTKQAHHLLSRKWREHPAIQKAAAAKEGFHIDEALNGIAIATWRNQPNHNIYDNRVKALLDQIPTNLSPSETYRRIEQAANTVRQAVENQAGKHLNDVIF